VDATTALRRRGDASTPHVVRTYVDPATVDTTCPGAKPPKDGEPLARAWWSAEGIAAARPSAESASPGTHGLPRRRDRGDLPLDWTARAHAVQASFTVEVTGEIDSSPPVLVVPTSSVVAEATGRPGRR
jgi:hypothetical protein